MACSLVANHEDECIVITLGILRTNGLCDLLRRRSAVADSVPVAADAVRREDQRVSIAERKHHGLQRRQVMADDSSALRNELGGLIPVSEAFREPGFDVSDSDPAKDTVGTINRSEAH